MNTPTLIILALVFSISFAYGQEEKPSKTYYGEEKIDDPYISVPDRLKTASPAYSFQKAGFTVVQVNVDDAHNNILGDAANEPSLAIDPTDPARMVIGWRYFETVASNFRQAGVGVSYNNGTTWTSVGPIEEGVFRSDPVLDTDSQGNFYFNSLTGDFNCDVFKTNDPSSWEDKTYAFGGDKQWMVVDKTAEPSNGHIYAFWKLEWTACPGGSFTRSVDQGTTFQDCVEVPNNPTRGTLAVGPDGALYACGGWSNTFKVLKSSSAKNPGTSVEWEQNITVDLKGSQALYNGPNPGGMLGQVWVAADPSGTNENVYLLATVSRNDISDPADIMFSRSTDGGLTWSEAIRINDDPSISNWQWFGSLSVAPNGRIDATWVDTRDDTGTYLSSLYYSFSVDGGLTWSPNERLSEAFDPHLGWPNQQKLGDYYHMISTDEGAHLAWSATFNGEQDVYYSFIEAPLETATAAPSSPAELKIRAFPNPAQDEVTIPFYTPHTDYLTITLLDYTGATLFVVNEGFVPKGEYHTSCDVAGLNAGMYFLQLRNQEGDQQFCKIIVE